MTNKEIRIRCRIILQSTLVGERISFEDGQFLNTVLAKHPSAERKMGCGIEYFTAIEIIKAGAGKTKCLALVRTDGTKDDFSFYKCTQKSSSKYGEFRRAVNDQKYSFKKKFFGAVRTPTCSELHIPLTPANSDVHHVVPFVNLVIEFLDGRPVPNALTKNEIKAWKEFHRKRAILKVISKIGHRQLNRRERV